MFRYFKKKFLGYRYYTVRFCYTWTSENDFLKTTYVIFAKNAADAAAQGLLNDERDEHGPEFGWKTVAVEIYAL